MTVPTDARETTLADANQALRKAEAAAISADAKLEVMRAEFETRKRQRADVVCAGGLVAELRVLDECAEDIKRNLELATGQMERAQKTLEVARAAKEVASESLASGHEWAERLRKAIPQLVQEVSHRTSELWEQERIVTDMRGALTDWRRRLEKARADLKQLTGEDDSDR